MRSKRRGQGLVEFALVLVLLFVVLCSILEFSWAFYNFAYLNNAVSKAARMAVVGATNTQIWTALQGERGGLPITTHTITVYDGSWVAQADNRVRTKGFLIKIDATMNYPSLTPLNQLVQMAGFTPLRSSCTCVIE